MKAYTLEIDFAQFGVTENAKVPLASTMIRKGVDYSTLADLADGCESSADDWRADLIPVHLRASSTIPMDEGILETRILMQDFSTGDFMVLRLKGLIPFLGHPKVATCCKG